MPFFNCTFDNLQPIRIASRLLFYEKVYLIRGAMSIKIDFPQGPSPLAGSFSLVAKNEVVNVPFPAVLIFHFFPSPNKTDWTVYAAPPGKFLRHTF